MAKSDVRSMFFDPSGKLLTEEENAATPAIIGPSSREALGLFKYPVRNIRIADIVKNSEVQFRISDFDPEHDEEDAELLTTMGSSEIGLLQPIMVQEIETEGKEVGPFGQGKKYQMVFGHRRLACAKRLGWEKIQAHVAKTGENVTALTLTENSGGKPQSPYEKAMAIRKYLNVNPSGTQQDISSITGWTQSYISRLLAVLAEDTPRQIIDLFAKGMKLTTVMVLKTVFITADPSNRDQLAQSLSDCSLESAQKIADSVQKGMDPISAVELYCGTQNNSTANVAEQSILPPGDNPVKTEGPFFANVNTVTPTLLSPVPSTKFQSTNFAPRLPSGIRPENNAIVEAFAIENGTSKSLVKALMKKAITLDLDIEELENACLISANCKDADLAVCYLTSIMTDRSSFSAFRQYAKAVRLILRAIYRREKDHHLEVSKALRAGVFSPLPLVPGKTEKK